MNLRRTELLVTVIFVAGLITGCLKDERMSFSPSVWRASNDYGDKPGNGIELVLTNGVISGTFFILEPEKPHNFDAGRAFAIEIVERRERELVCQVRFSLSQTDKFILKLPGTFPQNEFVAVTYETKLGTMPIEFRFKRVR